MKILEVYFQKINKHFVLENNTKRIPIYLLFCEIVNEGLRAQVSQPHI